jgi:hypothetical protein
MHLLTRKEQGDVQTSATIAFLLRDQLKLPHIFFARITAAYLSKLARLKSWTCADSPSQNCFASSIVTYLQPASSRRRSWTRSGKRAKTTLLFVLLAGTANEPFTIHHMESAESALPRLRTAASAIRSVLVSGSGVRLVGMEHTSPVCTCMPRRCPSSQKVKSRCWIWTTSRVGRPRCMVCIRR